MHKFLVVRKQSQGFEKYFLPSQDPHFIYYVRGFTTAVQKQVQNSLTEAWLWSQTHKMLFKFHVQGGAELTNTYRKKSRTISSGEHTGHRIPHT